MVTVEDGAKPHVLPIETPLLLSHGTLTIRCDCITFRWALTVSHLFSVVICGQVVKYVYLLVTKWWEVLLMVGLGGFVLNNYSPVH